MEISCFLALISHTNCFFQVSGTAKFLSERVGNGQATLQLMPTMLRYTGSRKPALHEIIQSSTPYVPVYMNFSRRPQDLWRVATVHLSRLLNNKRNSKNHACNELLQQQPLHCRNTKLRGSGTHEVYTRHPAVGSFSSSNDQKRDMMEIPPGDLPKVFLITVITSEAGQYSAG